MRLLNGTPQRRVAAQTLRDGWAPWLSTGGAFAPQQEGEARGGTDDQTRHPADGGGASMADHRGDSDQPFSESVDTRITDVPGRR